jgi:hypothetical protein
MNDTGVILTKSCADTTGYLGTATLTAFEECHS